VKNTILPEFQNFLLSRSLVGARDMPSYAHWVSKFLAFSNRTVKGSMVLALEYGGELWYQMQVDLHLIELYATKLHR